MKVFITGLLLLIVTIASAQTGTLKGYILDKADNAPVDSVVVMVSVGTVTVGSAVSDSAGYYVVGPLPPGRYSVVAQFPGYVITTVQEVIVSSDKTTYIDLKLADEAPAATKKKKVWLKRVDK